MTGDQNLAEAREICAKYAEARGWQQLAEQYRAGEVGEYDDALTLVIAAIEHVIEIGKGKQ